MPFHFEKKVDRRDRTGFLAELTDQKERKRPGLGLNGIVQFVELYDFGGLFGALLRPAGVISAVV